MKSPWEARVGMLLDPEKHDEFMYSYKPVDGPHGGQPKIDWLACDTQGRFWMIEVKCLPESRKSINLMTEVTAGQRQGLAAVAWSETGIALLAVGQEKLLRIYSYWEVMAWMSEQWPTVDPSNPSLLLPLDAARPIHLRWSGPKSWDHSLFSLVESFWPPIAPIRPVLDLRSHAPAPSASISKRRDSIPTLPLMRPLEP